MIIIANQSFLSGKLNLANPYAVKQPIITLNNVGNIATIIDLYNALISLKDYHKPKISIDILQEI